jgi:hypothetical protein
MTLAQVDVRSRRTWVELLALSDAVERTYVTSPQPGRSRDGGPGSGETHLEVTVTRAM